MTVGDRVRLRVAVGPCLAGSSGVIRRVRPDGSVDVIVDRDPAGTPMDFLLPAVDPNSLTLEGGDPESE